MSKNILIVLPWDQPMGGVASVAGNLGVGLSRRGYSVTYLFPGDNPKLVPHVTAWGFRGFSMLLPPTPGGPSAQGRVVGPLLRLPAVIVRLVTFLRRERIHLVNIHYPVDAMLWIAVACRWLRIPLITSVHGADLFPRGTFGITHPWGIRRLLGWSTRIVSPSKAFLAAVTSAYPEVAPVSRVVHNGIDPAEFANPRPQAPDAEADSFLLTIAAHTVKKAVDVLLRAFASLAADNPALRLKLVGKGPDTGALQELAQSLGIAHRTDFLGILPRSEIVDLLARCTLFVLPSRAEPFGIAALEAMASGKSVVATDVGGIPEFMQDRVSGLLVPPDDPASLAEAIRRILADPDRRALMGRNGRTIAERDFTTETATARYEEIFSDVLNSARRSDRS